MSVNVFIYLYSDVQTCILCIIKENYVAKLKLMERKTSSFYYLIPFPLQKKEKKKKKEILSINLLILNKITSQYKII